MRKRNILIVSESEHSSDMRYASGFRAPDPFVFARIAGRSFLLVSPLEYERACKEARVDTVINTADRVLRKGRKDLASLLAPFFKEHRVRIFDVPAAFPLALADALRRKGIRLQAVALPLLPERMIKQAAEIKAMRAICRHTARAVRTVEDILRAARISRRGQLVYKGRTLTSERLRSAVQMMLAERDAAPGTPIIAGGDQACDPHCTGSGPLRAGEPIIADIFPRANASGYCGDITRTFIKGRPTAAQQAIYKAVKEAQILAVSMVRPGMRAARIHQAVADLFKRRGFETVTQGGALKGFIHSTGHGLGLDIHEAPGVSAGSDHVLKPGNVITIEPGLYYPGIGGVRIEDDVLVTRTGHELLTRYPKRFMVR